jgi:hypothetical protein
MYDLDRTIAERRRNRQLNTAAKELAHEHDQPTDLAVAR